MKARAPFRSLFTTTSVAALLVTSSGLVISSGAFAGTIYSVPASNQVYDAGGVTDFIVLETTLENDEGIDGLVVTGSGNGAYQVTTFDAGVINVSDEGIAEEDLSDYDGSLNGILISDGAFVGSVNNSGPITVDARLQTDPSSSESSLYRDAAGIRIDSGAEVSAIYNYDSIGVQAVAGLGFDHADPKYQYIQTEASAYGIDFNGLHTAFQNQGQIMVVAASGAFASTQYGDEQYMNDVEDGEEAAPGQSRAEAHASSKAVGAHFLNPEDEFGTLVSEVTNAASALIAALATGTAAASVNIDTRCDISDECTPASYATGTARAQIDLRGYGVEVGINTNDSDEYDDDTLLANSSGFTNQGVVSGEARGVLTTYASVVTDEGNAWAGAGVDQYEEDSEDSSSIVTRGIGVAYGVNMFGGDFVNSGSIEGRTETQAMSYANATSNNGANARLYAGISTEAKGVELHAMLLNGGFENTGRIAGSFDVLIGDLQEEGDDDYYTPMQATARGEEDARAVANVNSSASATGIEIEAVSMMDDFVLAAGTNENAGVYATGNYRAGIEAVASTSAEGSLSNEATAYAGASGRHHTDVAGVEFYVDNLSGQFINRGTVSADSDLYVRHQATTNSADEGEAFVDAYISSDVVGIHIDALNEGDAVISGNFYNTGDISSHGQSYFQGDATANGLGDLRSEALAELSVEARGLEIDLGELQDNFFNTGSVNAGAYAGRSLQSEAMSYRDNDEEGSYYGNASAYAGRSQEGNDNSYVASSAIGIDLSTDLIGGHIYNEASVTVVSVSEDMITATAQAGDHGNADAGAASGLWASGTGIYVETSGVGTALEYVDNQDYSDGYIVNSGEVDVSVYGWSDVNATANAIDGSAYAYAEVSGSSEGNVSAHGLRLEASDDYAEIAGSVINAGDINVTAQLRASVNASAYVESGEEGGPAFAVAGGTNAAYAVGMSVYGFDIASSSFFGFGEDYAGFMNYGDITVAAHADQSTTALASSDEGRAHAIVGSGISEDGSSGYYAEGPNYVGAHGIGLELDEVSIDNGFYNAGGVSFAAFAESHNYAKADGSTSALALVDAVTVAHGIGMSAEELSLDETFFNSGMLYGEANAYSNNEAEADGDTATALIRHFNGSSQEAVASNATATGLALSTYGNFDFQNQANSEETSEDFSDLIWQTEGMIGGYATAASRNVANADADEGDAEARIVASDNANAKGMVLSRDEGGYVDFDNSGTIFGMAFAGSGIQASEDIAGYAPDYAYNEDSLVQRAYATADEGSADASVDYQARADATGARLDLTNFDNSGWIAGLAVAGGSAYAHAIANDDEETASAYVDLNVTAAAQGVHLSTNDYSSTFNNSGMISATALAYAYAQVEAEGSEELSANANASARAYANGVIIDYASTFDTITNSEDGRISARAMAHADERTVYDEESDDSAGDSYAQATGFQSYGSFNLFTNNGTIEATASATSDAEAVGLQLSGGYNYSFTGAVVNNGTISAYASAENPYATGILVSEDGLFSSIENFGTISATVEDTSEFELFNDIEYGPAIAIDIRGSEDGMQISQRAGEIIGNIVMANGNLDHFDWSGGTIDGDIYGDYEEDVINIYASTIGDTTYNDFTYDGIVDGADSFSVNGGDYTDAVSLRLTNQVRNVASFNVGPNASVNLGTNAGVQTDALNLNASSTLVFDINDTANQVNGVINTGIADLGGATVKAQFVSPWNRTTNVYRIINWDEQSDTTFGHVVSSSVLAKVTAAYGEDGADLLVQYLNFADLDYLGDDASSLGIALDTKWNDIDPDSPIGMALQELLQLTPDQFAYEMNQIAGQQTADIQSVTLAQLGSLIHVIQTQINEARTLDGGSNGDGISFSLGSDKLKVSSGDDFKPLSGVSAGDPVTKGEWRAWARVFGDWSELKSSNTAPGFKSDTGGVVLGADFAPSDGLTMGLAGGYQKSDMKFGGQGKGNIDSWSATAYMDYEIGNAYVDGLLGYSAQSYDMDRYLTVLGTSYIANADYDGGATIGAIEAGYKLGLGDTLTLTPFVGLNATRTTTDGTTETGAGVWNISYQDRSDTQVDSVLGARLSKDFKTEGGMRLTPTVELGWKHGFGDRSPTVGASLASIPGSNYTIFGSTMDADTAIVGAALQAQLTDATDIYVQYNGQYSGEYSENTASLRLRLKF
ncbi:MAG: autotransporter domain-containing protein [Parvibaculaceae bacterium]